jgi:hypothetical protein
MVAAVELGVSMNGSGEIVASAEVSAASAMERASAEEA